MEQYEGKGGLSGMGKIVILAGVILCLAGLVVMLMAVFFFRKQRSKLAEQINNEYKQDRDVS